MAKAVPRVALLARAGNARDQLRRALADAGAALVVEGDPADLDPTEILAFAPTLVLVGIEPAIESAMERFDSLLDAPGIEVMFDDAEVTNGLDGWNLNRWARHLVAKLVGTDLLPPSPAGAAEHGHHDFSPEPGAPQTPAEAMDHARLEDYTLDTRELADSIPTDATFSSGQDYNDADAEASEGELDEDVAKLAAHLEAFEHASTGDGLDGLEALFGHSPETATKVTEAQVETAPVSAPSDLAALADMDFGELSLLDADSPLPKVAPAPVAATMPVFSDSGLSLAPIDGEIVETLRSAQGAGAVVILAGLGGPDAVRQVLSSLPDRLPAPVLLYQHLEVGKYDRLVEQLAKVSRLPVTLACAGEIPRPGCVSVLPAGISLRVDGEVLRFEPGPLECLITALPASASVVVFLSGADASLVAAAMALRTAGGLAFAQDPEVCFDPSAALALQQQGAAVYPALGLARQIAARWSL
jgi:chemosensory pili system protein ChpB (putative protein-glutamate methylesterase)